MVRESTFLRANGQSRHAGTRCDVDGVWEQGRIEVARDACMRDARAMAEVALARVVRSADGREMGALRPAREAVALSKLVAIIFSINAWFSGGAISKINRDKCLKFWGSKIYLAINASKSGHEHGCRNIHSF